MNQSDTEVARENRWLKSQFQKAGLDLSGVWVPTPADPALENAQLQQLLTWLWAYRMCPDRSWLEQCGFRCPPIEPDFDDETDWLRFERWTRGEPLTWNYSHQFGPLPDPGTMTDPQIETELDLLLNLLEQQGIGVDLFGAVPDRAVYCWLKKELETTQYAITAPGGHWHIGCPSYCPGCFQRPWCELGRAVAWVEDEQAGGMVVPPEVEPFAPRPNRKRRSGQ